MTGKQLFYINRRNNINAPAIPVKDIRYQRSLKSRECVSCGCEIPKGDMYYSYKPILGKRVSRCIDCKPKVYNDYEPFNY